MLLRRIQVCTNEVPTVINGPNPGDTNLNSKNLLKSYREP